MSKASDFVAWFKEMLTFRPNQSRWSGTLRRVTGIVVPMVLIFFVVGPEAGLISVVGSTTPVAISHGLPLRLRMKMLAAATVITSVCMGLGVMSTAIPYAIVPMVAAVAFVATFTYHAIFSGPPGPIDFILAVALGAYLFDHYAFDPLTMVTVTMVAGILSSLISLGDVLLNPMRAEQDAVEDAVNTIEQFEELHEEIKHLPASERDSAQRELERLQHDATRRVTRAWNYLDAGHHQQESSKNFNELISRLSAAHQRFSSIIEKDLLGSHAFSGSDVEPRVMGTPSIGYRFVAAFSRHSQAFYAGLRIAVATAVAAFIVEFFDIGHPYWAVLTAGLMLHMYPDRNASVRTAGARVIAEGIGLGVFALMLPLLGSTNMAFIVIIVLLYINDWIKPRNAALSIIIMTPFALIISELGSLPDDPIHLIQTRAIETVIGIIVALIAVYFIGRNAPAKALRSQYKTLITPMLDVLASMSVGTMETDNGQSSRNALQYELTRTAQLIESAQRDDERLKKWEDVDRAIAGLGYQVMWLSWSDTQVNRNAASRAYRKLRHMYDYLPDDFHKSSHSKPDNMLQEVVTITKELPSKVLS